MRLIPFKGRSGAARVFVCPDMVCTVQDNVEMQINPGIADINTADGKCHTVQGDTADVVAALTKDPASGS